MYKISDLLPCGMKQNSSHAQPSKRWSFFSARSNSHTSAGQVAPSFHSVRATYLHLLICCIPPDTSASQQMCIRTQYGSSTSHPAEFGVLRCFALQDSGSSVSSTSVESVRRRSAMGSMTFTHSTTQSYPSKTAMR